MKIYLCGPINGRSDADCKDWRQEATGLLGTAGHTAIDPMARDFRGKENLNLDLIVEGDKEDIDGADALLVYFDKPSVGTSMEVLYAWERDKPVVIVNASGSDVLSPWLRYHAKRVYRSVPQAVAYFAR